MIFPQNRYEDDRTKNSLDWIKLSSRYYYSANGDGDYFYPLGMRRKKKKTKPAFIDQVHKKRQRENTWVIESNKKIIGPVDHQDR